MESIGMAREHVRTFLESPAERSALENSGRLEFAALVEDVLLVVSELVTNAVRHAPGPCWLEVAIDGGEVCVSVTDTSSAVPRTRSPQLDGAGGFGLHMLRALTGRGIETRLLTPGKTVSVRLS
jgi:anti-sigma regulatory factor (Ser/Thr protein kinase)